MAFWSFKKSSVKLETTPLFEPDFSDGAIAGVPGAWAIAGASGVVWAIAGKDTEAQTKAIMMAETIRILIDTPNKMESRCRDFISERDSLSIGYLPYLLRGMELIKRGQVTRV